MKAAPVRESAARTLVQPHVVPFDIDATRRMDNWRANLSWPLAMAPLQDALTSRQRAFLESIGPLTEKDGRFIALLAAGRCLSSVSALLEAALLVQAERTTGLHVVGGPAELEWLRGVGEVPPMTAQRLGQPGDRTIAMFARRIARTASWTPWWRLPMTMLQPDAVAITHNAMLREAAAENGRRVAFRHGEVLFHAMTRRATGTAGAPAGLAEMLTTTLCAEPALTETMRARLAALVRPKLGRYLDQAAADLAAIARAPRLPMRLWSGSGGNYAARALGIEVMRRGGETVRYDHGGSTGMIDGPDSLSLRETTVSTRFVVPTEAVAQLCRAQDVARPVCGFPPAEISHGTGDPHMRGAARLAPRPNGARPRVIYATGALYGFRQLIPPVLHDPVYLDWQLRVAEALGALPVDVLLKPHPEGIFRGQRHPLAYAGTVTSERFEAVMASADIFVFDFALSTAFWTALCSDRPVVLLDLGLAPFHPTIREELERRCRIVTAHWDIHNIPRVEREELGQAISDAARSRPDPTRFRQLIAGA